MNEHVNEHSEQTIEQSSGSAHGGDPHGEEAA